MLSASFLEQAFASEAASILPMETAVANRSVTGTLSYSWVSPCEAIGSLHATILDHEIMLSSNVFHEHIDQHCYEVRVQNLSDDHIPIAIVRAAIDEILAIFCSERTFSISYDQAGKPNSYSMTPKSLRKSENFLGSTPTKRFWDWQGEIPASE